MGVAYFYTYLNMEHILNSSFVAGERSLVKQSSSSRKVIDGKIASPVEVWLSQHCRFHFCTADMLRAGDLGSENLFGPSFPEHFEL